MAENFGYLNSIQGQTSASTVKNVYTGATTSTATVHVDNTSNIISVDCNISSVAIETILNNLDTRIDQLQEEVDSLENDIRPLLDTELTSIKNKIESLKNSLNSEIKRSKDTDSELQTDINDCNARINSIELQINNHINNILNPHQVTAEQVGLGKVQNRSMDSTPTDNSTNYVTSGGIKSYVDSRVGRIDNITVNGQSVSLPIINRNVTIPDVSKNGIPIIPTDNTFNVIVPTKTSDITNDSNYQTLADVNNVINTAMDSHNTSNYAHSNIRMLITDEATTREAEDAKLQTNITKEETDRKSADIELSGKISSNTQKINVLRSELEAEKKTREDIDADLEDKIDDETEARKNADIALGGRIDSEASIRETKDNELNSKISTEKSDRQSADETLQSNIDAEASTRLTEDNKLQSNITKEETDRKTADTALKNELQANIDAEAATRLAQDNLRVLISNIINNVGSTDTDKPLSANMGKELQDQIDNLKSVGRYLSNWDASAGLPTTDPTIDPYDYHSGDYFLVSAVSTADPKVNYKPNGSQYKKGEPSTTIETKELNIGDYYIYDSSQWILLSNTQKTVYFANIAGSPYDSTTLSAALNTKEDKANKVTIWSETTTNTNYPTEKLVKDSLDTKVNKNSDITAATHSKITYDAKGLVTGGTDLQLSDLSITADASEINKLDGVTTTTQQLNYLNTTTSNVQTQLNEKVSKATTVNGHTLDNDVTVTKADVELGNVDNKSEATIKSDFTGSIASGDTGFTTGGDVYTALQGKQDNLPNVTNDRYLHSNATTGALEWSEVNEMAGASSISAGTHGLVPAPAAGDQNKYLQGNGTWTTVDALPTQTGQSGKFLTTNGSTANWATVDALPSQTGQYGKYLKTDGLSASWANVETLPSQEGQAGKFLTTDGTSASWADVIITNTSFGTFTTDALNTNYVYAHNLNTKDVLVQITDSNKETIQVDVIRNNDNYVTIEFAEAPGAGTYNIYCVSDTAVSVPSSEEVSY